MFCLGWKNKPETRLNKRKIWISVEQRLCIMYLYYVLNVDLPIYSKEMTKTIILYLSHV